MHETHKCACGTTVSVRRASHLEAAAVWAELRAGAWRELDRIDDGLGRRVMLALFAGAKPRPWHLLSRREKRVVAEVAAGLSNREIAERLGVSISTVAGHLRTARKKLGNPRRLDLVREWRSGGLAT